MMENRKSKISRTVADDGYWDCSVCTFSNRPELFKCEMCDVRKGTSTRKPRLTAEVTQQFAKIENQIEQERRRDKRKELLKTKKYTSGKIDYNLKNKQTISINVCGVTIFITDYELEQNESTQNKNTKNELSDYSKSARSSIESQNSDEDENENSDDNENDEGEGDGDGEDDVNNSTKSNEEHNTTTHSSSNESNQSFVTADSVNNNDKNKKSKNVESKKNTKKILRSNSNTKKTNKKFQK